MKKRIEWIDNARGIGIILVIMGHALCPINLFVWLCTFHMPLFFFLAGVTYKVDRKWGPQKFIFNKFQTLIIPYFFIGMVAWLYKVAKNVFLGWNEPLKKYFIGIFTQIRTTEYGIGVWFLPCMFLTQILMYYVLKISKKSKIKLLVAISICYVIGQCYAHYIDIKLPWGIDCTFIAVFFMGLGILLKEYLDRINLWYFLLVIPQTVVGFVNYNRYDTRISMWNNQYGNVICFTVSALCGVGLTIAVAKKIHWKVIAFIGENSLYFYGFQSIILELIKMILGRMHVDTKTESHLYIITIGSVVVVLLVMAPFLKIYNWIIQKLQLFVLPRRKKPEVRIS